MASVDDQEKQSSKSWLRHAVESALIALDRPAGFLVPVGAAVVCIKAVSSFLDALLVHQTENAFLGEWACESSQSSFALKFALSAQCLLAVFGNKTAAQQTNTVSDLCASALMAGHVVSSRQTVCIPTLQLCITVKPQSLCVLVTPGLAMWPAAPCMHAACTPARAFA